MPRCLLSLCSLFISLYPTLAESPIRVMSYNIRYGTANDGENHWNKRKEFMVDVIRQAKPDLLGTQETLAFQRDYLQKELKHYETFGVGRDDGKEKGEMAALYYHKDRFEKQAGGHFWLSPTPEKVGSKGWDAALPRIATWVKLKDKQSSDAKPILFLNTHFDHMGKKARQESASLIRQKLSELGAGCYLIVTGDFNAGEASEPYQALFADVAGKPSSIVDTYRLAHPTKGKNEGTFNGFKPASTEGNRIDWIGCSRDLKVKEASIDHTIREGKVASDHFAIFTVLERGVSQPAAQAKTKIDVMLTAGATKAPEAPRYSPPGTQIKLQETVQKELAGQDHLLGEVKLGLNKKPIRLVLARSEAGKPYDQLYLENDGKFSKVQTVKPSVNRGKFWSSFEAKLLIEHADKDVQDYPVSLWVVTEKEDEKPAVVRYSRRGYLSGPVKLGEKVFTLVVSDSNNDGKIGPGDWWQLGVAGKPATNMRNIGDFLWAGGQAWKLEMTGTSGRQANLTSHNPGITEEEDTIQRDSLRADRLAKRAEKPVAFRKDVDDAIADARKMKQPYFLKFETDWCMPCKQMTSLVFTADDVVKSSQGIVCIIIDGDERKDLVTKHQVKGYPTGILFDGEGKEITRYVGYQSVKATTGFLGKAKR